MQILERLNLVVAEESEAEELRVSKPYGSVAQPMAVGAVRKPRPAQGQRQVQVILGGVEPVQQPGVPGRQHPRRLLRVGLADTIRVAAELPAAFAHAPPGPLAVVQMLGFVGESAIASRGDCVFSPIAGATFFASLRPVAQ